MLRKTFLQLLPSSDRSSVYWAHVAKAWRLSEPRLARDIMRFGVWDPHENPGRRPENRTFRALRDEVFRLSMTSDTQKKSSGAVARVQARTSTAMVRREQHERFHEWVLSESTPRAPRGTGVGRLHRHVNSSQRRRIALPSFHRRKCAQIHSIRPPGGA